MAIFRFSVGRLLCQQVREFLNEYRFAHNHIEWIESPGLFERSFIVKGEHDSLKNIQYALSKWARDNDLQE